MIVVPIIATETMVTGTEYLLPNKSVDQTQLSFSKNIIGSCSMQTVGNCITQNHINETNCIIRIVQQKILSKHL